LASGLSGAGQLPLDLPHTGSFERDDFLISPANERAFGLIAGWPDWPSPVVLLAGPVGSGKSHLAHIWAAEANARIVEAAGLTADAVAGLAAAGAVVVEDCHDPRLDQAALFHLINALRAQGGSLLVTTRIWPQSWSDALPDLVSRLRQATPAELGEPDDTLLEQVLVKLFSDRQVVVESSVIQFIVARMERSLQSANEIVALLDRRALAEGRRITRPWVAEILRSVGEPAP